MLRVPTALHQRLLLIFSFRRALRLKERVRINRIRLNWPFRDISRAKNTRELRSTESEHRKT